MTIYELTEEEIELIEKLRKEAKLNEKKLKKDLDDFVETSDKLTKIVTKIYDLKETKSESCKIIEQTIDIEYLNEIYKVLTKER